MPLIKHRGAALECHGSTWVNQEQPFNFSCANAALNRQSRQVNYFGGLIANGNAAPDLLGGPFSDDFNQGPGRMRYRLVIGRN